MNSQAQSSAEPSSYGRGVVKATIIDGLSMDLSSISPHLVRRPPRPKSKEAYTREMEIWNAYVAKFPGSDPRDMRVMKHFAEVIGHGIKARLETKAKNKTQKSDPHDYKHEGSRVDATNLLNMHCLTSARLQEICAAKPEHPLAEKLVGLDGLPLRLFAQLMVHWLVNIISSGALRDYKTIEDVLGAVPEEGKSFCYLEWADNMLDMPLSHWAKRAGSLLGLAVHAIRREILLKVNDSGPLIGQVAKFAAQRGVNTLVNHYLHTLTTIDGAAYYLGLQPRNDRTEEFRTAITMKKNPVLQQSMPSKLQDELESREDYVAMTRQINDLTLQIKTTTDDAGLDRLKNKRIKFYNSRKKLRYEEREKAHVDSIRHMMPERDPLARNICLRAPRRSTEGISVIKDLIALSTGNHQVAYQDVLQPVDVVCQAPGCSVKVER
ncbi:hypothetical protein F4859DRAFT_507006 [Xylaria cf. heliscus]|nr:hypothetical protein F4859DRAFT_507006 [Xylaria cf. heliscus]